jgi:hypothetical protein
MIASIVAALCLQSAGLDPGAVVSFPPHVGIVLSDQQAPRVTLALPWVVALVAEVPSLFRPSHVVLEVGAVFGATTEFSSRFALRWLRPVASWLAVGPSLGIGVSVGDRAMLNSSLELVAAWETAPTASE